MKRWPQCNRVETDEALAFCRSDGTPLVRESLPLNTEAGTAKFGSSEVAANIQKRMRIFTEVDANSLRVPNTIEQFESDSQ